MGFVVLAVIVMKLSKFVLVSKLSLLHWFRAIQLLIKDEQEYTASSLSNILKINYRSAQLLLKKIHFAYLVKENRLHLFQKVRESASSPSSSNLSNQQQSSPNEWNLLSFLESKINRLHSKLSIQRIFPNEHRKNFHSKIRPGFTNVCGDILFNNWIKTFVSIHLYPTFLKCFQLAY